MARCRPLYPGQWSDDEFVPMSFPARLMCLGIRNFADDNGIVEWNPVKLKMQIFPADNLDVAPFMAELTGHRHVYSYDIDGKSYGLIRNFHKWNRPDRPGYYHPLPQAGDVPEIAMRRLTNPPETDRRQVGDKSESDRRQVGDILGNGGGGGNGDRIRDGGGGGGSVGDKSATSRRVLSDQPSSAASFSKSKKNPVRRPASKSKSKSGPKLNGDPKQLIHFKTFPPITREQIGFWAKQFEGNLMPDSCNRIWNHLTDMDKKFDLGKSKGGMDKPIGDPIKNLHALLRKRYGH